MRSSPEQSLRCDSTNLSVARVVSDVRVGGEVANITLNKYGDIDYMWGIKDASTDFVSLSFLCHFRRTDIDIYREMLHTVMNTACEDSVSCSKVVPKYLPPLHTPLGTPQAGDSQTS